MLLHLISPMTFFSVSIFTGFSSLSIPGHGQESQRESQARHSEASGTAGKRIGHGLVMCLEIQIFATSVKRTLEPLTATKLIHIPLWPRQPMTFTLKASAADWEWENWNDPNAGGHGYPSLDFGTAGEDLARCFAKESFVQDLQPQLKYITSTL